MYPFVFWGSIFDDVDNEERKFSGCTFADSYTEAMGNIEDYYGKELMSLRLESLEESNVLEFTNPKEGKNIARKSY